ncbi:hypothetical protein B4098_1649 [Heyndrickxia coagulans]|uniref:Uncharacterized protein n=1 Tax=Heyndrickxia coagulans TaxID=1398 RepID=A0A150K748_HEYCO|nr:hypothetical protein B4098_1649 [Heyndrickxia coagulans]
MLPRCTIFQKNFTQSAIFVSGRGGEPDEERNGEKQVKH